MSGWWDSITSNAQLLVDELSAQANDATNDILKEQLKIKKEEEARKVKSLESLPWESDDESKAIISEALMADILQLALSESNFTEPPPAKIIECCNFDLQLFISQAMRLLSLDQNLAHIHAKISPKMDEESFWRNYFARIFYLRCKSGLLDRNDAIVQTVSSFAESDVIHQAGAVLGSAHASISVHSEGEISSPVFSHLSSSTEQGAVGEGKKPSAWESSSSEDISSSDMSTSSYEVLSSGHVGGSKIHAKAKVSDEEALFEAQLQAELAESTCKQDSGDDDDDFDDLEDLDDLDGDGATSDDDDELEAQIARELANEE